MKYVGQSLSLLSVPKFTNNMYCICLSIPQIYTKADAVQICGKFRDTQYIPALQQPNDSCT